jgi:para-nitrobenzyl esterase
MAARLQLGNGTLEEIKDGDVFKFLGILYTAPPVGNLRWRAPRPMARYSTG